MAAEAAAEAGCAVTLYDQMARPGRKFLLAGRGGLNLTHSEALPAFLARYKEDSGRIAPLVRAFPPEALRAWADALGAETFVGSSGRVFPKVMKASPLLRAWLRKLDGLGVRFVSGARLTAVRSDGLVLSFDGAAKRLDAAATVLALGGASWPELGSDAAWVPLLQQAGVEVSPLSASNAGVLVDWPPALLALAGAPLKGIRVDVGWGDGKERQRGLSPMQSFSGEAVLTARGLEGGVIYAANGAIRELARRHGWPALIHIAVKPSLKLLPLMRTLDARDPKKSLGPWLRSKFNLSQAAARLITASPTLDATNLANVIQRRPVEVRGFYPIGRAISTAGGVAWSDVLEDMQSRTLPGVFFAGEMLDWDAPTGGYLLQACLASGRAAGLGAAAWARSRG
jgi:hypothetical protein